MPAIDQPGGWHFTAACFPELDQKRASMFSQAATILHRSTP
jgi:hypothetical protein